MAADIKNVIKLDKILRLPILHKIAILLVLCGAVGGGFYWGLIMPKQAEIVKLDEDLEKIDIEIVKQRKTVADIPAARAAKEDLDRRLALALKQLPDSREIPQLIKSINDAAKKSGLELEYFQPTSERAAAAYYADVPISMKVKGSYDSLYNFCDKISKLSRIVNIEGISIGISSGGSGKEPILASSFKALTFRFIPEEEQAAKEGTK